MHAQAAAPGDLSGKIARMWELSARKIHAI